jgi:hypothetical protein
VTCAAANHPVCYRQQQQQSRKVHHDGRTLHCTCVVKQHKQQTTCKGWVSTWQVKSSADPQQFFIVTCSSGTHVQHLHRMSGHLARGPCAQVVGTATWHVQRPTTHSDCAIGYTVHVVYEQQQQLWVLSAAMMLSVGGE